MEAMMAIKPMTGQYPFIGNIVVNVGNKIRIEHSGKRPTITPPKHTNRSNISRLSLDDLPSLPNIHFILSHSSGKLHTFIAEDAGNA